MTIDIFTRSLFLRILMTILLANWRYLVTVLIVMPNRSRRIIMDPSEKLNTNPSPRQSTGFHKWGLPLVLVSLIINPSPSINDVYSSHTKAKFLGGNGMCTYQNQTGWSLLDYCLIHNLVAINTFPHSTMSSVECDSVEENQPLHQLCDRRSYNDKSTQLYGFFASTHIWTAKNRPVQTLLQHKDWFSTEEV